jgi:hypothetical protein
MHLFDAKHWANAIEQSPQQDVNDKRSPVPTQGQDCGRLNRPHPPPMAGVACKYCFKLIDRKEQHGLMNGTMLKCSTKRRLCCLFHRHSLLHQIFFQDYINDTYHSKTSFFNRVELAFKNITEIPTEEMATKGRNCRFLFAYL